MFLDFAYMYLYLINFSSSWAQTLCPVSGIWIPAFPAAGTQTDKLWGCSLQVAGIDKHS